MLNRYYKAFIGFMALAMVMMVASRNYQHVKDGITTILRSALYDPTGDSAAKRDYMTTVNEEGYQPEVIAMERPACNDHRLAADLEKSKVLIPNLQKNYQLGDTVNVTIQLYDGYGRPITTGGAVVRPRMFNLGKKAYSVAPVTDHGNGTYTAHFEALWTGDATIKVKIAYTPETIRAIYNFRLKLRSTREIEGEFSVISYKKNTLCHPDKKDLVATGYSQICNLTADNSGMPWFCGKPNETHLLCEDWTGSNTRQPTPKLPLSSCEANLLARSRIDMSQSINVSIKRGKNPDSNIIQLPTKPCRDFNTSALWTRRQTTGFMYENKWYLRHCKGVQGNNLFSCLRNKKVLLFGDSTVRHWYSYIIKSWNCQPSTEKWTKENWHKRTACINAQYNFTVQWLPHSHPFFGGGTNRYTRTSISRHLEETGSDEELIALLHIFMHTVAYHHSVFRDRIRRIRASVESLLNRNKFVKFLIKGPHTFYNTPAGRERLSDYYGLVYKHIMYEEFKDLHDKVVYLDQKDSTDALGLDENHPPEVVVKAMVDQMLAYIC